LLAPRWFTFRKSGERFKIVDYNSAAVPTERLALLRKALLGNMKD
jgi:hypothetical protein